MNPKWFKPAFPLRYRSDGKFKIFPGITRLEYFTAHALAGLCATEARNHAELGARAVQAAIDAIEALNKVS